MFDQEDELNPVNMLLDALRWNILNVLRVELFFNCYRIWHIFVNSSLQSSRGQYAIISLIITLIAQFAAQFNFSWLLSIYSVYLAVGMGIWLHRRVYFYHRRLDTHVVTDMVTNFDSLKSSSVPTNGHSSGGSNGVGVSNTGTLKGDKHAKQSTHNYSEHTNSLQRQRALAYRDFQSVLSEPRQNHREFALSLAHLSNLAKLVADKDVFDEMHFQVLATRRDVVNMILRLLLLTVSTMLAYFRWYHLS